jgi:alginate O-acetyltransferase complex protein AlgI
MLFAQFSFLFFLLISVPLFYRVRKEHRFWILTVSGIVFYAFHASWWVLVFFLELLISRFYRKGSLFCVLGALQAIGVLVICKYGPFMENTLASIGGWGPTAWMPVFVTLPLAVSFFTFEFVHFAADSYKGKIEERKFSKYAAFIFFFPTLVAGPIKRYQDFTPKVEAATLDWNQIMMGITRILVGFFKKFVIADSLAEWTKFLQPDTVGSLSGAWLWQDVFAYGLRIYFDFSGYADVAIGTALLFGIVVPENFNNPYLSRNISDFWKRWHVSLYKWLVDYIFIPLGGSRVEPWKVYRNILIVTTVSGLWHGAAWHFIFWGWYHGVLLCIFHFYQSKRKEAPEPTTFFAKLQRMGAHLLTFVLVMFGWTFFVLETESLGPALKKMFFLN